MTAVDDLVRWLTGVWDEEEAAMKLLGDRIWFVCSDGHVEEPNREEGPPFGSGEYERWADGEYRLPNHHNTWLPALDPASVLARIAADRKILAEHSSEYCQDSACGTEPCRFQRLFASPYRDRPGYQASWAVQ